MHDSKFKMVSLETFDWPVSIVYNEKNVWKTTWLAQNSILLLVRKFSKFLLSIQCHLKIPSLVSSSVWNLVNKMLIFIRWLFYSLMYLHEPSNLRVDISGTEQKPGSILWPFIFLGFRADHPGCEGVRDAGLSAKRKNSIYCNACMKSEGEEKRWISIIAVVCRMMKGSKHL